MTGTIVSLTRDRDFGYIRPDDVGAEWIFFHRNDVVGTAATFAAMSVGDAVTYDVVGDRRQGPTARITEWQPSGSIAQILRRAANDIDLALGKLNMTYILEGDTRRWDNFQHAKVHQHLRHLPTKLRQQATALTTKETLAQQRAEALGPMIREVEGDDRP